MISGDSGEEKNYIDQPFSRTTKGGGELADSADLDALQRATEDLRESTVHALDGLRDTLRGEGVPLTDQRFKEISLRESHLHAHLDDLIAGWRKGSFVEPHFEKVTAQSLPAEAMELPWYADEHTCLEDGFYYTTYAGGQLREVLRIAEGVEFANLRLKESRPTAVFCRQGKCLEYRGDGFIAGGPKGDEPAECTYREWVLSSLQLMIS